MQIITQHTSSKNSGRGQVIAKGMGRQLTVSWDHSISPDDNNFEAAQALRDKYFRGLGICSPCEVRDNGQRVWTLYI